MDMRSIKDVLHRGDAPPPRAAEYCATNSLGESEAKAAYDAETLNSMMIKKSYGGNADDLSVGYFFTR